METTKIVAYYRVSTSKQGLGIEAQRKAVADYLNANPHLQLIGEFTETFTGKESNRPQFQQAKQLCKRSGAILLAAKLDRLGRGRFLYSMLGDDSIKFKALDIAGESELEKSIRVAVAIEERKQIATRTSSALRAKAEILAKANEAYISGDIEEATKLVDIAETKSRVKRGLNWWVERNFKLGSVHQLSDKEKKDKALARVQEAETDEANINAANAVRIYLKQGNKLNYSQIANYLNDNNYKTRRGKGGWKPQGVKNLVIRFNLN